MEVSKMLKGVKYIGLVDQGDYRALGGDFYRTYYKDTLEGQTQGWTHNPETGIMHVKSSNSHYGYLSIRLGRLVVGDSIEFTGEFLNIVGKIGAFLSHSPNSNYTSLTWEEAPFTFEGMKEYFTRKSFTLNIKKTGYYVLNLGVYQTGASEFKARNIGIRLNSTPTATLGDSGSFTPTINSPDATYSVQKGSYFKLDNRVFCSFMLEITTVGTGTGALEIRGLPFIVKNNGQLTRFPSTIIGGVIPPTHPRPFLSLATGYNVTHLKSSGDAGEIFLALGTHITNNTKINASFMYEID